VTETPTCRWNGAVTRTVDPPTTRANSLTTTTTGGLTVAASAAMTGLADRAAVTVTSNTPSTVLTVGVVVAPKPVGFTATRFYRHRAGLVAVRTGGTGTVTDQLSWVVTDRQGTITATIPAGTTTTSINRYRPYGTNRAADAITATARGFLARNEDPNGLIATDHRLYDPVIGRFLTIDPLLDHTKDPYGYGAANPATWSDPSGLDRFSNAWEDRYYQQGGGFGVDAGSVDQTLLALYLEDLQDNTGVKREDVRFIATRGGNGGYQQAARAALDVAGDAVASGRAFITRAGALRSVAHPKETSGLAPISAELLGHESGARAIAFTIAAFGVGFDAARAARAGRATGKATEAAGGMPAPTQGQTVYRVYGGDSAAGGASWSPTNPGSVGNYRNAAGLPSGGASGATNTGQFVIEGTIADPSKVVLTRNALPLDGMTGGLPEYIIPKWMDNGAINVTRVSGVNPHF